MSRAFDLHDPAVLENPAPYFAAFRSTTPVVTIQEPGSERLMFIVTSYELVSAVLKDHLTYTNDILDVFASGGGVWASDPEAEAISAAGWPEVPVLDVADGEEHQRQRKFLTRAFSQQRVNALTPKIAQAADELIDRFVANGYCDFVRQFAAPLPLYMLADAIGVERSLEHRLAEWSSAYVRRNGQMGSRVECAKSLLDFQRYFFDKIQERRAAPQEDLLSELCRADPADGLRPLTDPEILAMLGMVVVGATETTRSAIASLIAHSLVTPGQLELLLADPAAIANAIDETLRFQSPGAAAFRVAGRDAVLGGISIPARSLLMLRLDSAGRDERVFANADRFDVRRKNANRHLGFGLGAHFCVGHVLARRELSIAIPKVLSRLKNMKLDPRSDLRNFPTINTHALREIHITFDPGLPITAQT